MNETGPSDREFRLGNCTVRILEGDILAPGPEVAARLEALVSSDDNYLTMGSGVARRLADHAGEDYVREAQARVPLAVGAVLATGPGGLSASFPALRRVIHPAVIDYDTHDLPLERAVHAATAQALRRASELGLKSILFPAFATGSGKLQMEASARQMCSAFKTHVAQTGLPNEIYLILWPGSQGEKKPEIERFLREAARVLRVPYDPALRVCQSLEFFARTAELDRLRGIVAGKVRGKRHALVVGGPRIGKSVLLDRLVREHRDRLAALGTCKGQPHLARVTFGRLHENTPLSFIYRRLLLALRAIEGDATLRDEITRTYADEKLSCAKFADFLEARAEHFSRVTFVIDDVQRLFEFEVEDTASGGAKKRPTTAEFWADLERLGEAATLILGVSHDDHESLTRKLAGSDGFRATLEELHLRCLTAAERDVWVEGLFRHYRGASATEAQKEFLEQEGGYHPFSLALAGHALIDALQADSRAFELRALHTLDAARRDFFDLLHGMRLKQYERDALGLLEKAIHGDEKTLQLVRTEREAARDGKPSPELKRLRKEVAELGTARGSLVPQVLERLKARGLLADAGPPDSATFCSPAFREYLRALSPGGGARSASARPQDVEIMLLSPEPQTIQILFGSRGAQVQVRLKDLTEDHRTRFLRDFGRLVYKTGDSPFANLVQVGEHIQTHFTSSDVMRFLMDPPADSTVQLVVDQGLQEIPWELILETAYSGDSPFRVGRRIATLESAGNLREATVRQGKLRALLIGNPTGDLKDAELEVENLEKLLKKDARFEKTVLLRSKRDCDRTNVLTRLAEGFHLVHYSGHSQFKGTRSAWQVADGELITTDELTDALRKSPPALVFSSSCESGRGGGHEEVRFENQRFDLPGAFLQAGVLAYIGTMWKVDERPARLLVEGFYRELLAGSDSLAECLRRAKNELRDKDRGLNWPAFILYGDPRVGPQDLFPSAWADAARGDGRP